MSKQTMENRSGPTPDEKSHWLKDNSIACRLLMMQSSTPLYFTLTETWAIPLPVGRDHSTILGNLFDLVELPTNNFVGVLACTLSRQKTIIKDQM